MKNTERNQRYFSVGRGEVKEEKSVELDSYRSGCAREIAELLHGLEKTEEEKKLLREIINGVAEVANEYGGRRFLFNEDMIHIIPDHYFSEINKQTTSDESVVSFYSSKGGIVIGESHFRKGNILKIVSEIAHELFHAYGVNKFRVINEDGAAIKMSDSYRVGFQISHGDKPGVLHQKRFSGLNEAVTQELAREFYANKIRTSKILAKQVKKHEARYPKGQWDFPYEVAITYAPWVHLFRDICEELNRREPDRFGNSEEAKNAFYRIYFRGNIAEMGSLLSILGKGAFDDLAAIGCIIGDYDTDSDLIKIQKFRKKYDLPVDDRLDSILDKE